jgi:hypothetical protein
VRPHLIRIDQLLCRRLDQRLCLSPDRPSLHPARLTPLPAPRATPSDPNRPTSLPPSRPTPLPPTRPTPLAQASLQNNRKKNERRQLTTLTPTPCSYHLSIPWSAAIHCQLCRIFRPESAPKIHVDVNQYRPVVGLSTETVGETSTAGVYQSYQFNRVADCRYDDPRDSKMPNSIMLQQIV